MGQPPHRRTAWERTIGALLRHTRPGTAPHERWSSRDAAHYYQELTGRPTTEGAVRKQKAYMAKRGLLDALAAGEEDAPAPPVPSVEIVPSRPVPPPARVEEPRTADRPMTPEQREEALGPDGLVRRAAILAVDGIQRVQAEVRAGAQSAVAQVLAADRVAEVGVKRQRLVGLQDRHELVQRGLQGSVGVEDLLTTVDGLVAQAYQLGVDEAQSEAGPLGWDRTRTRKLWKDSRHGV